jgi:glycosyltransferase involved in cell wall biosynthesis
VDPDDAAALVRAVKIAVSNEATRGALRAAGLRRAAQFSWDRTAARVDALLSELAGVR